MQHSISHPHAVVATFLAGIDHPQRAHINRELQITGTPRSLYTLARLLCAAKMYEMTEIDRVNAAHPAIVAQAVREFDGTNIRELVRRHDISEVHLYRALRRRNGKCLSPRGLV